MSQIPKILHQIWIGKIDHPGPLPGQCQGFADEALSIHTVTCTADFGGMQWYRLVSIGRKITPKTL